ncbi:MAG: hypothetical protein IPN76_21910 [Saprospiraceae bacterium]|nr:hypothetical protein [Saprospiraceae bacterium]
MTTAKVELNTYQYNKNKHHLLNRIFLPIVGRSKKIEGAREGDIVFGVLEAGNRIDSGKKISEDVLLNLKLYIDNCAQVYQKAYTKENEKKHEEYIDKYYEVEDSSIYLKEILGEILEKYHCNKGYIALITQNEDENTWEPKNGQNILINIEPLVLQNILNNKERGKAFFSAA